MTIIASNPTLTARDYPDFDQTVGNPFASSFKDTVDLEDENVRKIQNVTQGLYKIYETVVDDAAKGSPMTPTDSAVIANTVANMTSSIGVESTVTTIPSLESRYEQHLGFMVTQESLSATIVKAIKALIDSFMKLMGRVKDFLKKMFDNDVINARAFHRAVNTASRWVNLVDVPKAVSYTPAMAGILVDGQIPSDWFRQTCATLEASVDTSSASDLMTATDKIIQLLDKAMASKTYDYDAIEGDVMKLMPKITLPHHTRLDGTVVSEGRKLEYSKPMAGNVIAIAMNPHEPKEPIDFVNSGAGLIPLSMASEFGITERYKLEPNDDSFVSVNISDYRVYSNKMVSLVNNAGRANQSLNGNVILVEEKLKSLVSRYRSVERDVDTDNDEGRAILQYMGVCRSLLSASVACLTYNFEARQTVVSGATAAMNAFNS